MATANDRRFAWTEFYVEFADKLLQYKDDRGPLVKAVNDVDSPILSYSGDGTIIDVCPFTVIGSFNCRISDDIRKDIATEFAQFLQITVPVPEFSSYNYGIPLLYRSGQVMHINEGYENSGDYVEDDDDYEIDHPDPSVMIPGMWRFFADAIAFADGQLARSAFIESYDSVKTLPAAIGYTLTIMLFWARPRDYLPLDTGTRKYVADQMGIRLPSSLPSGEKYLELRDLVKERIEQTGSPVRSFPQLAWVASHSDHPSYEPLILDTSPESSSTYTISSIIADGCFLPRTELEAMLQRLSTKQNLILQGPPGTGKTWLAKKLAYALIGRKDDSKVRPMQFHPNLSYEDFVRGWRPQGDGRLELVDGPFLQVVEEAREDPDSDYVMVIEEINRGNPASIFGEMLTLLEADKRNPNEALALAYPRKPGERVHIPPNVYVIGTMNLADRSLAMVDLALRRRFAFFDLEPMLNDTWREWVNEQCGIDDGFLAGIAQRINALNEEVTADRNLGRQFRIGHSFVTPAAGATIAEPAAWFSQVVETEIVPLLHEYWFDDPDKVANASENLLRRLQ